MKKILVLIFLLTLILSSCRTIKYVPVDKVKNVYVDKFVRDSIHVRDSIFIKQKKDTVFVYKTKTLFKYKYQRDTLSKTDTITKIQKVTVVKKTNELNSWQRTQLKIGWISFLIILMFVILKIKKIL